MGMDEMRVAVSHACLVHQFRIDIGTVEGIGR
jgi:hypothetical protein